MVKQYDRFFFFNFCFFFWRRLLRNRKIELYRLYFTILHISSINHQKIYQHRRTSLPSTGSSLSNILASVVLIIIAKKNKRPTIYLCYTITYHIVCFSTFFLGFVEGTSTLLLPFPFKSALIYPLQQSCLAMGRPTNQHMFYTSLFAKISDNFEQIISYYLHALS